MNFQDSYLLPSLLEKVGFRGDRLSVWAIQVYTSFSLFSWSNKGMVVGTPCNGPDE